MTTVPAGLAAYPDVTPTFALSWAPTATNWTNFAKDISPAFLASVNVAVVGQSDAQKEPAKTMNAWWTTNQQKIKDAGFAGDTLKVSSWAMIVDIEFSKTAPKFYSAVGSGKSVEGVASSFVNGKGCTATAIASGEFCLPENATTHSLYGVCNRWSSMCLDTTCALIDNCKKANGDLNTVAPAVTAGTDVCVGYTVFSKPAAGDVGDEVGVLIWNKTATKKIPGIRIGRRVVATTNCVQDATWVHATEDVL